MIEVNLKSKGQGESIADMLTVRAKKKSLMDKRKEEKQIELFEEDNTSLENDWDSPNFEETPQILENNLAYLEGVRAHVRKKSIEDNPYPKNTNDHHSWFAGWYDKSKGIAQYRPAQSPLATKIKRRR